MVSRYEVLVREHHVDSLGHMNNAMYLTVYEEARWELITAGGFGFKRVQEAKKAPVILDIHLKFLREIRLREKIVVTTELLSYSGKVGQMRQQMLKQDGVVASEALLSFGLFDLQLRKLIDPTEEWMNAIGLKNGSANK